MNINIFDTSVSACRDLALRLSQLAVNGGCVALSGGNTPKLLFSIMATEFCQTDWSRLKFFWGDERMVPVESSESNYGEFFRILVESGKIHKKNVFATDYYPDKATALNAIIAKMEQNIPFENGLPCFDIVILGVGEDGHIASIFPNNLASFSSEKVVELVQHPVSKQERITITGSVINNAREVIILCTGEGKKEVMHDIFVNKNAALPATHISTLHGVTEWYLDKLAAEKLK